jgi:hypothetical protein
MMKTQCWRKKMTAQIKIYRRKKIRASIRDSSNCFYAPCCRWKQKHGLHIRTRCHIRTLECCDIAAGWLQNMSALFMFTMSMYQNTLWLKHRQITKHGRTFRATANSHVVTQETFHWNVFVFFKAPMAILPLSVVGWSIVAQFSFQLLFFCALSC